MNDLSRLHQALAERDERVRRAERRKIAMLIREGIVAVPNAAQSDVALAYAKLADVLDQ